MAHRVLIFDDNTLFRDALARRLEKEGFDARSCEAEAKLLRAEAQCGEPLEILIDLGMDLQWLETLKGERRRLRRARFWLITGAPDTNVEHFHNRFPGFAFQQVWFSKLDAKALPKEIKREFSSPHPADQQADTNATPEEAFILPAGMEWLIDHPNPIRLINRETEVLWTNKAWGDNPYTPEPGWLKGDDKRAASTKWLESHHWGPLPNQRSPSNPDRLAIDYYLFRQRLRRIDGRELLLQWIAPLAADPPKDLNAAIQRVLDELTERYFSRARFYRICPMAGNLGAICLWGEKGGLAESVKLPHSRPMWETLRGRFDTYTSEARRGRLVSRILKISEVEADEEREEWNRIVGFEGVADWLEIPVFAKNKKIIGLLICDRKGWENGSIPPDAQSWLGNSFLHFVASLRKHLEKDKEERLATIRRRVLEEARHLYGAEGRNLPTALLDIAQRLLKADGGVVFTHPGEGHDVLELTSKCGDDQKSLLSDQVPASAGTLPALQAWRRREALVVPFFPSSEIYRQMVETGDWSHLCAAPENEKRVKSWLESLGSILAAPLRMGDRVVGAISIHHAAPMHFDDDKVQLLNELLTLAAPILEMDRAAEGRRLFQGEVIHRFGTRIAALADDLEYALEPGRITGQGVETLDEALDQARHLRRLTTILRKELHPWALEGSFPLHWEELLTSALDSIRAEYELGEIDLKVTPKVGIECSLKGDREAYAMALHNLIANACRHRRGEGKIEIRLSIDGPRLALRISNPGAIAEGDEEEIFLPERRGRNAHADGLGMGLALSRRVAQLHGGSLTLIDHGRDSGRVAFRLLWPLNQSK